MLRLSLQLVSALVQIATLAIFLVIFPRFSEDAAGWTASYLAAISITTPVFMCLGFELRKRTASDNSESPDGLNFRRGAGALIATLLCTIAYPLLAATTLVQDGLIYFAVVAFKAVDSINDQIIANYEWSDRFRSLAISSLLKVAFFTSSALIGSWYCGPTNGIWIGCLQYPIVWALYDRTYGILPFRWLRFNVTTLDSNDWFSGFGSGLVALTVHLPRILGLLILGESAINAIGVGQSLNRVGQILNGSMVQTFLAMQSRKRLASSVSSWLIVTVQAVVFVLLVLGIPLWTKLFDYTSGVPNSVWLLIFTFGLLSQLNYMFQSQVLVSRGGSVFALSPTIFLAAFSIGVTVLVALSAATLVNVLFLMNACRIMQILYNFEQSKVTKCLE